MPIEEGKAAPAFTLKDAKGNKVALKDFKGKDVIVYFYPKDDTPGCTKEACGFRDHWKKIQKTGAVVLGISPDDEASHQKFIAKYKLPFTLLSDPNKKGHGEVRRLGREDDVREEDRGCHPLHHVGRARRQGEEALEAGRQGCGSPGQGAGAAAGRRRLRPRGLYSICPSTGHPVLAGCPAESTPKTLTD